jgi:hypothetical protein
VTHHKAGRQRQRVANDSPVANLPVANAGRFLGQFKDGTISKFQPYSKFPPCYKDIAFWLPGKAGVKQVLTRCIQETQSLVGWPTACGLLGQ